MALLVFAGYLAMTAAVVGVVAIGLRWLTSGTAPWPFRLLAPQVERARARRRPPSEPVPPVLLGLELRRLAEKVREVDAGDQPAKAARLDACRWAYDYVLLEYCRAVDVPVPRSQVPLSERQRFAAESALISAGHEW